MPKGVYDRSGKLAKWSADTAERIGKVYTTEGLKEEEKVALLKSMAGRKVNRVYFHNGIHVGIQPHASVEKSLDVKRSNVDMTIMSEGLYVVFNKHAHASGHLLEKGIGLGNLYEWDLIPDETTPKAVSTAA